MSTELWTSIATIIAIAVSRTLSHFEHKKNQKKTDAMMNGELKDIIQEAVRAEMNKR